jgi:chemotaxis protein MotA
MARTHLSTSLTRDAGQPRAPRRRRIDSATLLGFASGFGLVAVAMTVGGSPWSFFDLPAFLIVIGGTFGVTMICFPMQEMLQTPRVIGKALMRPVRDAQRTAWEMLSIAEFARKKGVLEIEESLVGVTDDHMAIEALELVADGVASNEIELTLRREIDAMVDRHMAGANVMRKAADVSPAMGLIGTLIGLVQMLSNLEDPSSIGPSMAIALLTTFYGAILSNMMFAPLAAKLERNSAEEALAAEMVLLGASSISRKENPRRLETSVNALLPPAKRVWFFE